MKLAQDGHRLRWQRDAVGPAHLHAFGRDRPNRLVEVEFGPPRRAQLAGAGKQQRHEPQRGARCGLAAISVDGLEELA